ncbi:MAG: hypothetical protein K2H55_02535, partial [Helicobacter sp.]|nr:hypothetical protein [Helicobacter sp.]
GVDKFDIEASSFTKTLTIAGNLGTVPNYEEARNNYDTVRIDLSKTSGVNLDISRLLVSNPNDDGIQIVASKGQDNITLVAGANHDVIEFKAGGGTTATQEIYTITTDALKQNQSIEFGGVTLYATVAATADTVASAIAKVLNGEELPKGFLAVGKFEGFSGDWALKVNGQENVKVENSGSTVTITQQTAKDVADFSLTLAGSTLRADTPDASLSTPTGVAGADAKASASGTTTIQGLASSDASATTFKFAIDDETYTLTLKVKSGEAATGITTTAFAHLLTNGALPASVTGSFSTATLAKADGTEITSGILPAGITAESATGLKLTLDEATFVGTKFDFVWYGTGSSPTNITVNKAMGTVITLDFGEGLLAGQSYTYLNKTVLATKDLTAEDVANAFKLDAGETLVDGAVVVGNFASNGGTIAIDPMQVLFEVSGSSLIITDTVVGTPASTNGITTDAISAGGTLAELVFKGYGSRPLDIDASKFAGETTKQGLGNNQFSADSYVTYVVANAGGKAASGDTYTATTITLRDGALDTITNFDIANDKLTLTKFNEENPAIGKGYYGKGDIVTTAISLTDDIYLNAGGAILTATLDAGSGLIEFGVSGDGTASDITLAQKFLSRSSRMAKALIRIRLSALSIAAIFMSLPPAQTAAQRLTTSPLSSLV